EYGPVGYTYRGSNAIGSASGSYPADNPPHLISGLDPGTTYDFHLVEYCSSGSDSVSSVKTISTVNVSCDYPVAVNPHLTYSSGDSVVLDFISLAGSYVSLFRYEYGPSGFNQSTGTLGSTSESSVNMGGL